MNKQFTQPKERIRFAILTFFFAQGLGMANWASRIRDFKDVFAANYAFYWGLILFMSPVGKFAAPDPSCNTYFNHAYCCVPK